jgi:glycosyltransferase involved in cell wall biosynthesis
VFAIPAARLARVPVVIASVHDLGVYQTPIQQQVHVRMCRLADRTFVVAEAIRAWLVGRGCDPAKVTVLRNGIDLSRFRPSGDGQGIRRELGVPPTAPVVAMIARLVRGKGIEDYLAAAARVTESFPDTRFLLVGEGYVSRGRGTMTENREYRQQLEWAVARLGLKEKVVFTGFRSDIADLLQAVAVSVLPSLSEGLSNVVLESMAAGVPVIATRVGGIPEAVTDGVTGLLVAPSDPAALAGAICRVLADKALARALAEASRRRVATHFSLERMVAETAAWYQRLLTEATSRPFRPARRRAAHS